MEKPTARWSQSGGASSGGLKDSDESDAATPSPTPAATGATSSNAAPKQSVVTKPSEVCTYCQRLFIFILLILNTYGVLIIIIIIVI